MPAADERVRFRRLVRPEAGDVDITREGILVSVGRGIGEQDNIELVEELAAALGGAVSSSRPIADAGWLPRTRQVGKSGPAGEAEGSTSPSASAARPSTSRGCATPS